MLSQSVISRFIFSALLFSMPVAAAADFDLSDGGGYRALDTSSHDTIWAEALERGINRALNPDDYICSAPTDLDLWVDAQFSEINELTLLVLDIFSVFRWAFDTKVVVDNNVDDEYIGVDGEHTRRQQKTFRDNQRFWDIFSDDILLMGGHGAEIADDDLMQAFMPLAFNGFPPFVRDIILTAVRSAIEGGIVDLTIFDPTAYFWTPGMPGGYDNPLFSLNALAFTSYGEEIFPGSGIIPDKIVMGEGLIEALSDIGIDPKSGPDYVLSHEFAHHVQFEIGAFEPGPPAPEKTRRTELMADGFSAYYNSHARGNTFQAKQFTDVMTAAYEGGDCAFLNNGHHGTHLQRLKATIWGQMVSEDAADQGHIYPSATLLEMFDQALPTLVAPDAP